MIRINLLPYREVREKEKIHKQMSIFFFSFLVVVVVLLVYNISLQKRIDGLNTKIANNKKLLAKFEKQAKEVDRIKNEFNNLEKKTKVIKNLEKKRKDAFYLLDNMTKIVAENTSSSGSDSLSDKDNKSVKRLWFTNFQAKGNNIDIKGIAMDNKTVADFMTRLEVSKLYKNVNLKTLKQQKISKLNLKSFEITCNKISLNKSKSKK
ncbi:MAG: PilN domain-containing protein [Thermodesulfobacteriota bacterium]|nr:PilN domain-containing protein [Thermodesulfobacteriota bacterium]